MYKAFRKYSKDFQIEFVRIAPLIGDYKIIYTEDGVNKEIYVEYKTAHCRVSGRSEKILVHHQAALGHTNRCIFTWKAKWDYIFHSNRVRPSSTDSAGRYPPGVVERCHY